MLKVVSTALVALLMTSACVLADTVNSYVQTNLTSDLPGMAANLDPNLVNPWGLTASATSPFWIADNHTGLSTIYDGTGAPLGLVVTIPPPVGSPGPAAPTGIVFNSTSSFSGSHFIFDTEDGTVAAWSSGTSAVLEATSPAGSVYKGLAIGNNGSGDLLYAANFGLGRVDVFDANFAPTTVSGGFKDANIPAGYAPFNIRNINGNLYVTFAQQDAAKEDDVPGAGHGFVDVFDMNGNLVRRFASQGALNSPWGMTLASSNFGAFSGDLLIGNFGNGEINAYDPATGSFLGALDGANGNPIAIDGLWALDFGNGAHGQGVNTLFFTAGIAGPDSVEDHGLFGSLATPVPEPASVLLVSGIGFGAICLRGFRRRARKIACPSGLTE